MRVVAVLCLALACRASAALLGVPPSVAVARSRWGGVASAKGLSPTHAHPRTSADLASSCTERWFDTQLDHFGRGVRQALKAPGLTALTPLSTSNQPTPTFPLRYFTCDMFWAPRPHGEAGPTLFYTGNEADVELYVNHTGWMWESASELGALLVFAEHRYYGRSWPFSDVSPDDRAARTSPQLLAFLTSEQALADYAALVVHIRRTMDAAASPVIALGGSYGGMLAAWARVRYPWLFDGALAASAPIWGLQDFPGDDDDAALLDASTGLVQGTDPGGFAAIVTRDASPAAGSPPACVPNLRAAWQALFAAGSSGAEGLSMLSSTFRLCGAGMSKTDDVAALADWLQSAFDYLAMGNFPYPSDYLLNSGGGALPAWPVRAACARLSDSALSAPGADPVPLLAALRDAAAVFYNATGQATCYELGAGANAASSRDGDLWTWQACTELTLPMSRDGVRDAFWAQPWNGTAFADGCAAMFSLSPGGASDEAPAAAAISYGGRRFAWGGASNIVFSNGRLDPWSATGVLSSISRSIVAVSFVGGHHQDLMFSSPDDPPSVHDARRAERAHITRWVKDTYLRRRGDLPPAGGGGDPGGGLGDAWSSRATQLFIAGAVGASISAGVAASLLVCLGPGASQPAEGRQEEEGSTQGEDLFPTPASGHDSARPSPQTADPMRQPLLQ